jgi:hypothetical protein
VRFADQPPRTRSAAPAPTRLKASLATPGSDKGSAPDMCAVVTRPWRVSRDLCLSVSRLTTAKLGWMRGLGCLRQLSRCCCSLDEVWNYLFP